MVRVSQCTTGVSNFEAEHACERWRAPHRGRRGTEFRTGVATGARAVGDPTADVVNGVTGTAMNAVNAILALCGAAPGSAQLPRHALLHRVVGPAVRPRRSRRRVLTGRVP
jgi:hypothetical protein